MKDHLKRKAQKDLLNVALKVFENKNNREKKAPSLLTETLSLYRFCLKTQVLIEEKRPKKPPNRISIFKKLEKGKHELKGSQHHRIAQGLINELLYQSGLVVFSAFSFL